MTWICIICLRFFFFSSRRRHTRSLRDWSSDVCSSDLDTFFVVRHGTVAVGNFVPPRGELVIETLEAGDLLGWSWLFPPYRSHFDARALSPVRATQFDGACLRDKCAADPAFGYGLMSRFAQVLIERLQWTRLRLLDIYGDGR